VSRRPFSRRDFLSSAAAFGSAAFVPSHGLWGPDRAGRRVPEDATWRPPAAATAQAAPARSGTGRIDVHSHIAPPSLIRALGAQRLGNPLASWTPEKSLADMDAAGVSTSMISIAPAGTPFSDPATAGRLTRECNEYTARLAADHPGRFGLFASLPLPNVDASLAEIAYAFDTLKADGVGLFTSYGDKWLGDPAFNRVFEELNRRRAVVYTHPITAACCGNLLPNVGDGIIEWGTDTTRAIARIVFGGAAARYPNVRLIFSHAGGTMPFLVERFVNMAKSAQLASQFPEGFEGVARKFFFDTAQTSNPAAMSALSKVVPVSQIVFGTDFPFRTAAEHVKGLSDCGVFTPADLRAIDRQNALALLPKFR
jgi:predicted TIM-barrel fold metal-dependent hydrolase